MSFSWITFVQSRQALASRLADPNNLFWSDAENGINIIESLRTLNALSEIWNTDFSFNVSPNRTWYDLSVLGGSPRLRSVTDVNLYTAMQYSLLEPASGGTWTGTSQFSLADLQTALQRRRDEVIQLSGCRLTQLPPLSAAPGARRITFPDSTLEPRRARFLATSGSATTLTRGDKLGWNAFEPAYPQTAGTPTSWSMIAEQPLAMDVDYAPATSGKYDVIALQSGADFNPPSATLLGVPDDWSWLPKWGALADLLGRESEATDRQRADYCLQRYNDGLKVMQQSNWLLTATINALVVDTPSLRSQDGFSPEWEVNANAWPALVSAGMDMVAPCPVGGGTSAGVTLVGNCPVPVADGDFVQVARDIFDAVLDYAQVLACFKMGGSEFKDTADLEKNFIGVVVANNKRLAKMGVFSDMLRIEGRRQDIVQPR